MSGGLTIAVAAKLHANQLERHLELFERMPEVDRVLLVRKGELAGRLSKVEAATFSPGTRAGEAFRLAGKLDSVLRADRVDWVVGFNPVPWGSLALAVARHHHVPCCLSLIGMDFLQVQRWWGAPFLHAVKQADRVTVTGDSMLRGLVELGVRPERITSVPHSVDLDRFRPGGPPYAREIIAVGQLILRKRMDVLIDAVGLLRDRGSPHRLTILGRGPLEAELRLQVERLQLQDWVEFLGYVDDVERFLSSARVFSLASEWEGVPFALMEAMASGLVPVVTNVGTIADWVHHDHNGWVVERNAEAFAAHWERALGDDGEKLRSVGIAERANLGLAHGVSVWQRVLGQGIG